MAEVSAVEFKRVNTCTARSGLSVRLSNCSMITEAACKSSGSPDTISVLLFGSDTALIPDIAPVRIVATCAGSFA